MFKLFVLFVKNRVAGYVGLMSYFFINPDLYRLFLHTVGTNIIALTNHSNLLEVLITPDLNSIENIASRNINNFFTSSEIPQTNKGLYLYTFSNLYTIYCLFDIKFFAEIIENLVTNDIQNFILRSVLFLMQSNVKQNYGFENIYTSNRNIKNFIKIASSLLHCVLQNKKFPSLCLYNIENIKYFLFVLSKLQSAKNVSINSSIPLNTNSSVEKEICLMNYYESQKPNIKFKPLPVNSRTVNLLHRIYTAFHNIFRNIFLKKRIVYIVDTHSNANGKIFLSVKKNQHNLQIPIKDNNKKLFFHLIKLEMMKMFWKECFPFDTSIEKATVSIFNITYGLCSESRIRSIIQRTCYALKKCYERFSINDLCIELQKLY